MVDLLI